MKACFESLLSELLINGPIFLFKLISFTLDENLAPVFRNPDFRRVESNIDYTTVVDFCNLGLYLFRQEKELLSRGWSFAIDSVGLRQSLNDVLKVGHVESLVLIVTCVDSGAIVLLRALGTVAFSWQIYLNFVDLVFNLWDEKFFLDDVDVGCHILDKTVRFVMIDNDLKLVDYLLDKAHGISIDRKIALFNVKNGEIDRNL